MFKNYPVKKPVRKPAFCLLIIQLVASVYK